MALRKVLNVNSSALGREWIQRHFDERDALAIGQRNNLDSIVAQLISARGIKCEDADTFLSPTLKDLLPNPSDFKDMDVCVDRIINAIQGKEKITIYGDYDVDGATSTSLFLRFFRMVCVEVGFYIPDRKIEGYGPNIEAFRKLKAEGVDLIITVDCGTVSYAQIQYAKEIGLDVIVVDHHAGEPELPNCVGVINPNRFDEDSPYTYLAAVGVSFLVCIAINRQLRSLDFFTTKAEPNLISLLDVVALGTVCDVVPLVGLNRAFVAQGLKILQSRQNTGIRMLVDSCGIDKKINTYHLGYVIGPRINAGGRVGTSTLGTQLLSSDNLEVVAPIVEQLNAFNEERKIIQDEVLQAALAQVDEAEPIIIVHGDGWHQGVIGIVAGRLKETFNRPTFVISFLGEEGKASGRSIPGFDMGQVIHHACQKSVLVQGGGHPMAGGFSVMKHKLEDLKLLMKELFYKKLNDAHLKPQLELDGVLTLQSASLNLIESIEQVGPFGSGNPAPKFAFKDVQISYSKIVGEKHVKCSLLNPHSQESVDAMAFNAMDTDLGPFLLKNTKTAINLAGSIKINSWGGKERVSITIDDASL